jgi:hypothetical protein
LLFTRFEIIVAILASVLLISWPFGASWVSHRALSTQRRVVLVPFVAALATLLVLAIPLSRSLQQVDVVRLSFVLLCSSSAAAAGSCLVVLGLTTAGLRTGTRLLTMLLLVALLYVGVLSLALIPFGRTPNGWWVDPNPLAAWVPFIAALAVPALVIRRTRAAHA